MANVIASGTTVSNGTIKKNNFLIGVNTSLQYGPTSSTGFWNGVVPVASGYTVYEQKSVNGPSIRTASNDTELITIAKQYGGTNITTVYDALSYFNGQSNYLVTNIDYPNIVTSGLTLMLDAGYIPSYPRTGTTWNDLSGNGNNPTLFNSPSYNTSKDGNFVFNGTNQYLTIPISSGNYTSGSLCFWVKKNSSTQTICCWSDVANGPMVSYAYILYITATNTLQGYMYDPTVAPAQKYINGSTTMTTGNWYNCVFTWQNGAGNTGNFTIYLNGENQGSTALTTAYPYQSLFYIAAQSGIGGGYFNGNIANTYIYNRALSQTEITQNYNAQKTRFGL